MDGCDGLFKLSLGILEVLGLLIEWLSEVDDSSIKGISASHV
jgi:hypothetical protein